jgi:hypothetical protein
MRGLHSMGAVVRAAGCAGRGFTTPLAGPPPGGLWFNRVVAGMPGVPRGKSRGV